MTLLGWVVPACLLGLTGDALMKHARAAGSVRLQLLAWALWVGQGACWWVVFGRPDGFARAIAVAAPVGVLLGVALGLLVFGERLTPRDWLAVGLGIGAVLVRP